LSTGQVTAIVANVSSRHASLFAAQEAELVPELAQLSVGDTVVAMRTWRLRAGALDEEGGRPERPSELHISETMDGRRELSGHLAALDRAIVAKAVEAASPPAGAGEGERSAAKRRAEGLVEVCRQFLANLGRWPCPPQPPAAERDSRPGGPGRRRPGPAGRRHPPPPERRGAAQIRLRAASLVDGRGLIGARLRLGHPHGLPGALGRPRGP
jgi:hypothetical protein